MSSVKKNSGKRRTSLKKKVRLKSNQLPLVWPSEREIMLRPDRYRYVRKIIKVEGCVFCHIQKQGVGIESLIVHSDEEAMVVLNKYPYNTGHCLVIPHKHCDQLKDLSRRENHQIMDLIQRTVSLLKKSYGCPGFNVGLNLGSVAGAGIPEHLHWHVIPRWHGDTNFFPLIAETKVLAETLEQTYSRLRPLFEEHLNGTNDK